MLIRKPQIEIDSCLLASDYATETTTNDVINSIPDASSVALSKTDEIINDVAEDANTDESAYTSIDSSTLDNSTNTNIDSIYEQRALDAEDKISDLQKQIDELQKEHEQDGYKKGIELGQQAAQAEFDIKNNVLSQLIDNINAERSVLTEDQESAALEIAFIAIRKIIGENLVNKDYVLSIIKQTASQLADFDELVLRLSRNDYELIGEDNLLTSMFKDKKLKVVADDRVVIGGCIIETPGASLDGRLEVQLQILKEAILNVGV